MEVSNFENSAKLKAEQEVNGYSEKEAARRAKEKRLDTHFIQQVCILLSVLFFIFVVCFGLLELSHVRNPLYNTTAKDAFRGELVTSLIPGIPLFLLSLWQLRKIRLGHLEESPIPYYIWAVCSIGFPAAFLIGWLVS